MITRSKGKAILSISFFLYALTTISSAQETLPPQITLDPESGLTITSPDQFMSFGIGFRLQQDVLITTPVSEHYLVRTGFDVRRARTQFNGFLFHGKLDYLVILSLDHGNISLFNAEYRWKPDVNTRISFGQLRPPTGRQFQTISSVLQMPDRSIVSRYFALGYDIGVAGKRYFEISENFGVKLYAGITHGEGSNIKTADGGLAYTGRVEVLPFGKFNAGGDYKESDLFMEPTPKLSLGGAFYHSQDAYQRISRTNPDLWRNEDDNIQAIYADGVFKYNGFSLLGEYIHRTVDNEVLTGVPGGDQFAAISGGSGFSIQGGKVINPKTEPTFRISILDPNNAVAISKGTFTRQLKYSVGLNKFLRGHNIKLQTEASIIQSESYPDGLTPDTRTSVELLTHFSISF